MYVNSNECICRTIYPLSDDSYVLELNTIIKTYACNSSALITVDSVEISIDSLSPITFKSVSFDGNGCLDASAQISPNGKIIQIFYPNFSSFSSNMQLNESNCKASIIFNIKNKTKCLPLRLNYRVSGQAFLDDNIEAQVSLGCEQLKYFKCAYSNNYSAELDINLIKFRC